MKGGEEDGRDWDEEGSGAGVGKIPYKDRHKNDIDTVYCGTAID